MGASLKNTKFITALVLGVGLIVAAFFGKFSGDLGLAVSGIAVAYITGRTLTDRAALANGKESNE